MRRTLQFLLPGFLTLVATTYAVVDPSTPAVSGTATPQKQNPAFLHGYAATEGIYLNDPVTDKPLVNRYIEVITVVGDPDPPFDMKDDRVQTVNPEYNSAPFLEMSALDPGLINATFTIFVEEPNPEDERVQLWETIMIRVYNALDKESATHYCDSSLWKTQAGFYNLNDQFIHFSAWKEID